ncbi:MAG: hypothetical protein K9N10_16290 [Deltaproteobacteria bacterium]|nr:hypothetical protein [Deltaproteobacteria bacterium]
MNEGRIVNDPAKNSILRSFWPVIILLYWLGASLLHLEFSKIIISPLSTPLGTFTPANFSFRLAWGLMVLTALFVLFRAIRGQARLRTLVYWIIWGAALYGTNRFLVFSPNEYAHYPQYALLAVMLVLWRDPHRDKWPIGNLIFWGTALGIIDEMMQYLFVCPSYGEYLDFNDFLLNELGVVAGLLLVYGFKTQMATISPLLSVYKTRAFKTIIISFVIVLVLISTGHLKMRPPRNIPPGGIFTVKHKTTLYLERTPGITGAWNNVGNGRVYYVLSPAAGLSLLFALGLLFSSFDPRVLNLAIRGKAVPPL